MYITIRTLRHLTTIDGTFAAPLADWDSAKELPYTALCANRLYEFFVIMLFYALGELLSAAMNHFIPGSVLGMFLLFIALQMRIVQPRQVGDAAKLLTRNMGIFFIPAGVGMVTQWALLRLYWLPIVVSMMVSSALVMGVVALMQQAAEKKLAKRLEK